MHPHHITVAEAADILKVTPGRVRQLIVEGRLTPVPVGTPDRRTAINLLLRSEVLRFDASGRKKKRGTAIASG